MAKITDQDFIDWVLKMVTSNPGTTAREIHLTDERKILWPDLKKGHSNSALYQLAGAGKVVKELPEAGSLAPRWFPSDQKSNYQEEDLFEEILKDFEQARCEKSL
tara:strand:- start:77 stop:391 length:315 start_codon:yes stop_codon:yes gene_type:complete